MAQALELGALPAGAARRREPRDETLRIVEYTRLPRRRRRRRIAFTRDLSDSGMCIGTDEAEPLGALLRVELRDQAGAEDDARVQQVVWCEQTRDGRHWLGLGEPGGRFLR